VLGYIVLGYIVLGYIVLGNGLFVAGGVVQSNSTGISNMTTSSDGGFT